ncbi:MAG: 23S rRNA (uracil(1939)-C(5))-methyltransferase RlmD [Deltaproteobacteria bacterium]|nr:23S rRNA (uracil(1939)-C(5))-methyltransferase RlmD [Deltaproteobacteria bacterium]
MKSSCTTILTIDALSHGPAGIGRAEGKVIFVPGTVPGDEVEVALQEEKKRYATGHVVQIRQPSAQRRTPPCPYVSRCGGCPWQQVSYPEQLRAKELNVREQLRRIGGMAEPPMLPIIPAPQEWHYRHRIRLHGQDGHFGFSPPQSHEVVEIESCHIAREDVAAQLRTVREWSVALRTAVRQIEIIGGELADTTAPSIVLVGEAEGAWRSSDDEVCGNFLATHPRIAGLVLLGAGWRRRWGNTDVSFMPENDGTVLSMRHGTFTQVNPTGNRALVDAVLGMRAWHDQQKVIELYSGAGNLSLPIARRARSLVGIEHERAAVIDAEANAVRLGLTNVRFLSASVESGVHQLLQSGERGDVVVLNPPRSGAAAAIDLLPRLGARAVLYVSCDPATLARDLRQLHTHGYQLHAVQPVDLFPQTYHVETITLSLLT